MSGTIVICEKPSQAKAIRAAIGNAHGEVLPAVGHLLTLMEPDDVRDDWKTWSAELLWPGKFYEKKPIKDTRSYLDKIRAAARGASKIIVATDCDREGQLIGDEIVDYIGFRGTVMRAIFNAEDKKSLQDAFSKLEPNTNYRGRYMAGQAREQADQTTNLSLTRTATVTFKAPGSRGAIGIGRVKTPVLGIVCKRELEIENFVPQDMFEIDAQTAVEAGVIVLTCAKLPASLVKEQEGADSAEDENEGLEADDAALEVMESTRGKIVRKDIAEGLKAAVIGYSGKLRSKAERKKQGPPKLFDLTALQSACSSRFGWSGDRTLSVAQKLYSERTLITYPRGEAKYLPENNIKDIPTLLPALLKLGAFNAYRDLLSSPQARRGKSGHFSDKALDGLSHYAIIPNVNTADTFGRVVPTLSPDEAKLFDMVVKQYLAALAPDHEYRQTTVDMTFPWKGHDWDFRATGRVPLVPGWKAILGGAGSKAPKGEDEDQEMCPVRDGEMGEVTNADLRTVTTRPPARYTEGSLIKVMQEAWRLVDDPKLRSRLKEAKGIGTPATRGDVVKGLLQQQQMIVKNKSIMPTPGGMQLYKILMSVCPNVVDPARTAIWETIFDSVEKGAMTAEDAVARILGDTQKEIDRIKHNRDGASIAIGAKSKPTPAMLKAAKSIAERKGIKLPAGCMTDSAVCKTFLDQNMPKRETGADGQPVAFPPSEKQMAFAERISGAAGIPIPEDAKASAKLLSAWIDANMKKAPSPAPSEKQLAFARKLADENGIDLPDDVETSMKACSAFIDKMMSGGSKKGGGKPSRARKS